MPMLNPVGRKVAAEITSLAVQFLVGDLPEAIAYYRDRLGFDPGFVYQSFYASVSRDGFSIHLKCAPKTVADRAHRKQNEHLDAHIGVRGIEALFDELKSNGAHIIRSLEDRPWGCKDFYVEDPDGYILCFSEETKSS
jgi:catechol 2,3-dioxygenase-like lactoylglutathione lyase family enzyme